jgi:hypothetical protein
LRTDACFKVRCAPYEVPRCWPQARSYPDGGGALGGEEEFEAGVSGGVVEDEAFAVVEGAVEGEAALALGTCLRRAAKATTRADP